MSETRSVILERGTFWAGTVKDTKWDLWYGLITWDDTPMWGTCYFNTERLAEESVREHLRNHFPMS